MNSVWFKLYLYHCAQSGPPSVLYSKGTRVRNLPKLFQVNQSINQLINQSNESEFPNMEIFFRELEDKKRFRRSWKRINEMLKS